MLLTPYTQRYYSLFNQLDEIDRIFQNNKPSFKTDIKETKDSYILESELAGFNKEDIKVSIDGDYLTITAEKKVTEGSDNKSENSERYLRRERSYGLYTRSFNISETDADKISASYTNGVLTLTLPKKSENKPLARELTID